MKKKFMMIIAALTIVSACTAAAVMPALANSDVNSTGNLVIEDGDTAFYGEDIEKLNNLTNELSLELPQTSYVPAQGEALKDGLNSKGAINYDSGKVIFDSSDLVKLADKLDNLNAGYKYEAVNALGKINTYFEADGSITHDNTEGTILPENASGLSFAAICDGILKSQSVEHLAEQNILPASEDNLSEGCAAWVNGTLLIGNGNDNKNSYEQGREDGRNEGYEAGKAENPAAACYYLGAGQYMSLYNEITYDIKSQVPDVDYTQLTENNFIICPYKVSGNSSKVSKYISTASNLTVFSTIPEIDLSSEVTYDAETGKLTITPPVISAKGGISSLSGYTQIAESDVRVYTYLVIGDIEERKVDIGDIFNPSIDV